MPHTQHLYFLDTLGLNSFNVQIGNEFYVNLPLYRYSKNHYLDVFEVNVECHRIIQQGAVLVFFFIVLDIFH